MASPPVSTPSSAGSPATITLAPQPPTLAIKTVNASNMNSIMPGLPVQNGVTRKEWVIPPRPKPGRKPATDTPPTKRKAQNRAAQRAFRERRAARVGELEEQLEETKEEQQKREGEMRNKITRLEADVQRFSGEVHSWRLRCDTLDRMYDYEKREKENALAELAYLRKGASTTGTEAVPLPPRHLRHPVQRAPEPQQYAYPQFSSPAPVFEQEQGPEAIGCGGCTSTDNCACVDQALAMSASGCGKCSMDSHCECLEETIKINGQANLMDLKRAHSPPADDYSDKRQRYSEPSTPLEVDFTAQFSSKPSRPAMMETPIRVSGESCGFCEEGTYCMCAEAAAMAAAGRDHENRLPPLLNEVTPPPSDTDMDASLVKLPSLQPNLMHRSSVAPSPSNSCVNGPGTCQQCQSDPRSGNFCRSLAAMRAAGTAPPDGCCGGNANGGGCCKTAAPAQPPPSLSCADTYRTLSTHKGFEQASDEPGSWLGRLHATPPIHQGRAPMEVEAASVLDVLKLFDRRFGRG